MSAAFVYVRLNHLYRRRHRAQTLSRSLSSAYIEKEMDAYNLLFQIFTRNTKIFGNIFARKKASSFVVLGWLSQSGVLHCSNALLCTIKHLLRTYGESNIWETTVSFQPWKVLVARKCVAFTEIWAAQLILDLHKLRLVAFRLMWFSWLAYAQPGWVSRSKYGYIA